MKPNDHYIGRTAPLTSKRCILYIYSTNIGTEYFKCGIYSPSFPLQNAVCFINLMYLDPVLFTFYIQGVLKLKKNNSGAKRFRFSCDSPFVYIMSPSAVHNTGGFERQKRGAYLTKTDSEGMRVQFREMSTIYISREVQNS